MDATKTDSETGVYTFFGIQVNVRSRMVINLATDAVKRLSPQEAEVLGALCRARSGSIARTLSRDFLMDAAQSGGRSDSAPKLIDVLIWRIRRKLDHIKPGARERIVTEYGAGYRLSDTAPPTAVSAR